MDLPRIGQTDVGLGILTEANLAQEASLFYREGVLTLVEELICTMESLTGFISIFEHVCAN